jgi:fucose 4-O-acetylase-like acetyltransferase
MSPLSNVAMLACSLFIGLVSGNWVPANAALALQRACSFFPFFVLGYILDLGYLRETITRKRAYQWVLRLIFVGFLLFFFCCPGVAGLFMSNTLGDLNFDYAGVVPVLSYENISEEVKVLANGLMPVVAPVPRDHCGSEWALSFVHRLVRYELGVLLLLGLLAWIPASPAMAQYGKHTMYPYLLHPWFFQLCVTPIMARHMPALLQSLHGFWSGGHVWSYTVLLAPMLTLVLSSTPVRRATCIIVEPKWIAYALFSSDAMEQAKPCETQGISVKV